MRVDARNQVSKHLRAQCPVGGLSAISASTLMPAKQILELVFRARYGITVILMRFHFDERKSGRLRANSKRGIGFEEAQEVFSHPYYLDQRSDLPEQYRAIGWVGEQLYTVIFEVRQDEEGEYYHLVTLWKATKQEQQVYGEHS